MADLVKVKVKAQAYEKYQPKTLLSQFENDLDLVDRETLIKEIQALREWILENVTTGGGGNSAIAGGSISAQNVADYNTLIIKNRISAEDVSGKAATPVRLYFYGGEIKQTQEATL